MIFFVSRTEAHAAIQMMMRAQDTTMDSIAGTLHTIAQQASLMGQEINEHNECVCSPSSASVSDFSMILRPRKDADGPRTRRRPHGRQAERRPAAHAQVPARLGGEGQRVVHCHPHGRAHGAPTRRHPRVARRAWRAPASALFPPDMAYIDTAYPGDISYFKLYPSSG